MRKCTNMLVSVLGAASLTFALALTGCGQATDAGSADTEETAEAEATEEEAAGDEGAVELEIPENLGAITKAPGALLEEKDELKTVDLAELPESGEESVIEDKGDVEEDDGDASKAPANTKAVTHGGMSFYMPNTWQSQAAGDEYYLMSGDGAVFGCVQYMRTNGIYDVSAMTAAIPYQMQNDGYTDITVTDYGTGTSSSGTLVDSYIQIVFTANGTRCVGYFEYLQSKNYITYLGLSSDFDGWKKNMDGAAIIVNTVSFAPGEAI